MATAARNTGIQQMKYYSDRLYMNTDALIIGNSRVGVNLDYSVLWKEYGIAAFWAGAAESYVWHNYYRLVETCKHHIPKLVILDITCITKHGRNFGTESNRSKNYLGLPLSVNKMNYVNATLNPDKRLDFFLDIPLIHSSYFNLKLNDLTADMGKIYNKGQEALLHNSLSEISATRWTPSKSFFNLTEMDEYYIREIIKYCGEKSIPLLMVSTLSLSYQSVAPYYNSLRLITEEYGIDFLDMNQFANEINLETLDWYVDKIHFNVSGARKCAKFLGEYLQENYHMVDHRGVAGYESWDLYTAKREDSYMRIPTDNDEYFQELARDKRKLLMFSHNLPDEAPEDLQPVLDALDELPHESMDTSHEDSVALGDHILTARRNGASCEFLFDGKSVASIYDPGVILIVYDELLGQIADVAEFPYVNNFSVRHLYTPPYS